MLKAARTYEEACRTFRWRIPDRYNLAFDVCDRQTMAGADGHRTALIVEGADGTSERYTFVVLRLLSNRLANVLAAAGVGPGDRVLVSLPASVEAAITLLAVTKMGAVAVPVPPGMGVEPMAWRLSDSGARVAVVDAAAAVAVQAARDGCPALGAVLAAGEAPEGTVELWSALETAADSFSPAVTAADDAALLFHPADCCGRPRGVLHAHRALPGNLPAVEFALDFLPRTGDIVWTSAEWMSFEGLMWGVLPAWHHGLPVVAAPGPFDAERALGLMARHGVRAAWLPAADMAALVRAAAGRPHPLPRALAAGPEPLPEALHAEAERLFGVPVNPIWGVCETGALAATNAALMERRPGSPGRAVPGATVEAWDDSRDRPFRAGERGVLAAAPGAPGLSLGYWGKTEAPPGSGWRATGRLGMRDIDGWLWPEPLAVEEGIVMVAGRRVAPAEIEAALIAHPCVSEAAVLVAPEGRLDAYVVAAGPVDAGELRDWVGARRALHEAPSRTELVESLPRDAEGRVRRDELAARPPRIDPPSSDDRWLQPRK